MFCALCLQPRELRASHIVPEFAHRPLYDEKHRYRVVGQERTRPDLHQKGLRESLLCDECEARFQRHEDWFARYWRQAIPTSLPPSLALRDLDYASTKLLMLSIVWRSSVADGPTFAGADLGPRHEENLRRMLLDANPGDPVDYPIWACLVIDPKTQALWDHAVMPPIRFKIGDVWCYRIVLGGAGWTVQISRHRRLLPASYVLSRSGDLTLPCVPWQAFATNSGFVDAVRRLRPDDRAQ